MPLDAHAIAERGFEAWAEEQDTGRTWAECGPGERAAWLAATAAIIEAVNEEPGALATGAD